jgi:quercetin dioxygenase-like cupin family protein
MAIEHAAPGQLIDVRGPAEAVGPDVSQTLIRADHVEVFRYGLRAGTVVDMHRAAGMMIVQCIDGIVDFTALGVTQRLSPGTMLYLDDAEPHGLTAVTDVRLLITILLHRR